MTGAATLIGSATPLAERFDLALVDLDGVAYKGHDPIDGAARRSVDGARAGHAAGVRHQQRVARAGVGGRAADGAGDRDASRPR